MVRTWRLLIGYLSSHTTVKRIIRHYYVPTAKTMYMFRQSGIQYPIPTDDMVNFHRETPKSSMKKGTPGSVLHTINDKSPVNW